MESDVKERLAALAAERKLPRATCRIQFSREQKFEDAAALAAYLAELGISHLYASPVLKAGAESTHGYDITDHDHLNPNLGGDEAFTRMSDALRAAGVGLILDIVPNHMGIADPGNRWWQDVLENGPASAHAQFFDINWHPAARKHENRIVLPILEEQYGRVLEEGKLALSREDGAFSLRYYDFVLPLAPQTWAPILEACLPGLKERRGEGSEPAGELESILTALRYLPPRAPLAPEKIAERTREKEVIKRRLVALAEAAPEFTDLLGEAVRRFNGEPGRPETFDALDRLIDEQSWRPAFWRVAGEEINFRRFFDINHLAGIRVELPEVFEATHRLIMRLLGERRVDGLRIDHPDGLWDPQPYLRRLQVHDLLARLRADGVEIAEDALCRPVSDWLDQWIGTRAHAAQPWPLFVVVEKILTGEEPLPADWACAGTTGYDFLNDALGVLVDRAGQKPLDRIYAQFTGAGESLGEIVNRSKKMIMLTSLASEVNMLALRLEQVSEANRRTRDFTLNGLTHALREVIAAFPVYRTYITHRTRELSARDRGHVEAAIAEARRRNPRTSHTIFDFIRETLLLENRDQFPPAMQRELVDFIMKFQQVAGPVMAKGVEDTSFYLYNRLVALNEVGGEPDRFGLGVEEFHARMQLRRRDWPHAMLATATHDTKRGEDTRARLAVLSELSGEWRAAVNRWGRRNATRKTMIEGAEAPDRNTEYLFYQAVLGSWPAEAPGTPGFAEFRERIGAYMEKATREAKEHTSWISPNAPWDEALKQFADWLLDDSRRNAFLGEIGAFAQRIAWFGRFNSLAQTLLKLTAPGIPDIYQGTELWDLSLVDPDNRRPVDWNARREALARLRQAREDAGGDLRPLADDLVTRLADGEAKLYLVERALDLRRRRPVLFEQGDWQPFAPSGGRSEHLVAFARRAGGEALMAVAPRLVATLLAGEERLPLGEAAWGDTRVPLPSAGAWRSVLTGERFEVEEGGTLSAATLLGHFPVALMEREE